MGGRCPNSLVVKHVLGKDESQVRFLLRAPGLYGGFRHIFFANFMILWYNLHDKKGVFYAKSKTG